MSDKCSKCHRDGAHYISTDELGYYVFRCDEHDDRPFFQEARSLKSQLADAKAEIERLQKLWYSETGKLDEWREENSRLREALEKIAHQSCCDSGAPLCCDTFQETAREALRFGDAPTKGAISPQKGVDK